MSDISREELISFTEAHSKSAIALEKITEALESITEKQDKIIDRMTNGVTDTIVKGVVENYNAVHKETISSLDRIEEGQVTIKTILDNKVPEIVQNTLGNSSIARDIQHVKWFVAIFGLIIMVATIVVRGLDNRSIVSQHDQTMMAQTQTLQHLLQDHLISEQEKGVKSNGTR